MHKQLLAAGLIVLLAASAAPAWWVKGHGTIDTTLSTCSLQQFQYDSAATNWYAVGSMITGM